MSDSPDPTTPDTCCEEREIRAEGWDGPGGHHTSVVLEKISGAWQLLSPGWFSTPINYCPWCGKELENDKFDLQEGADSAVDNGGAVADDVLDALERTFGAGGDQ